MKNIMPADQAKITGLISALVPDAKIYLFGSRARGTHAASSDIDIAVDAGSPLPRVVIDEANSIMLATNIMYHIDVVDFNRMSDEMRLAVLKEGVVWKT